MTETTLDEFRIEATNFLAGNAAHKPVAAEFVWGQGDDDVALFEEVSPDEEARQLADGNGNSPWPADLFSARPGERSSERQVTLSDGRAGMVFVVLKVDALLPCGLPQRFERIITTELAGSRMVSREVFTLSAP